MANVKPKRNKRVKKMELSQFKSWIDGISEMQEDDWHPSLDQWVLIKSTIASLKNDQIEYVEELIPQPQPHVQPSYSTPIINETTKVALQSSLDNNQQPIKLQSDTAKKLKQDIDTSDGNYESDFA